MKPTVYIESSVISYHCARPARDVIVLARQELTRYWWESCLFDYAPFISVFVLEEISKGDSEAAQKRLQSVADFPQLPIIPEIEPLFSLYVKELQLPERAYRDALHIAMASVHKIEYLVTWNCAHIANAVVRKKLAQINMIEGIGLPVICTPEELTNEEDADKYYS